MTMTRDWAGGTLGHSGRPWSKDFFAILLPFSHLHRQRHTQHIPHTHYIKMAPTKRTSVGDGKGATVSEEKRKLLQQYKDDDGHFSLVR